MTVETELTREEINVIEPAIETYRDTAYCLEVDSEKLDKISKTLSKVKDLVFEEYQGKKPDKGGQ